MFEAGSLIYRIQTVGAGLFKAELAEAERAAKKTSDTLKGTAKATKGLGDQSRLTKPRLHEITGEIRGMSQEAQGAAREVGGSMLAIGASVVAMVGLTVKASSDWESAWAGVTKTVEGTPAELAAVEAGLRAMTKEMPAAHAEIAAVAEAAGQLGVKTKDVVGFTRVMIDLGETTNLSSDQAATSLAQLMNIMRTAPKDVGRLGSTIVALGNAGASTEAEIVSMAQRIAGSGALVGATEGEVLALANALASMGVTAELGGGVASRVLQDLYSAVQTGGEELQAFADVAGMSAEEFATAFENDPIRAMGSFAEGLNGVESSGGNVVQTLKDLGFRSTEEQRLLLQLKSAGDLLTDSLELQNTAWQENTALTDEASKRYETSAAQLAMAKNKVVDMAIELGEHLLPAVVAVAEGVGGFADMVGSLPEPVQGAIAIGGALIGMLALAGGAALIAIPKVVAFRVAVETLTTTMPKTTGAVKGFASFLGGPWGVALAAGIAGLMLLDAALKAGQSSSEEITNALVTAKDSADQFSALGQGKEIVYFRNVTDDLENMSEMLDKAKYENDNWWARFTTETHGFRAAVKEAGAELAILAASDMPAAQKAFRIFTEDQNLSEEQLWTLIEASDEFKDALIEQATALGINASNTDDLTSRQKLVKLALGDAEDATKTATEATQSAAAAYVEAAGATSALEQDLSSLLEVLDEANGKNQDAISANADYQQSLDDVAAQIKAITDGTDGYAKTLDLNEQAGRDNMAMLQELAEAGWAAAESQLAVDGNTEAFQSTLEESRANLIAAAEAMGYTTDEAVVLADKILRIPTKRQTEIIVDTVKAKEDAETFHRNNNFRRVKWFVDFAEGDRANSATLRGRKRREADGSVRTAADGYVESMSHQQAQIQRGGSYVLWAEDETQGESFIPHAKSKRAQAEQYMEKTAQIFGGTYIPAGATMRPMADGGLSGSRAGADLGSPLEGRPINLTVRADDPATVARLVVQNLNAEVRLIP